ncbi:MAG: hypothetical protein HY016_08435 [Nitrosomonadales bacterium]|nr:hypothetical protein [Nitrosomonadales bacterium]
MNKKFEYECEIAKRFLDVVGISYVDLADPLETFKKETGADVHARLSSGKKIGIQVTVFHSDEDSAKNGSEACRGQEEKDKKLGIIQTYGVPTDYRPALRKRIGEKISKAQNYSFSEFDEVWLVVAASLPQVGAMASTTMLSLFIDADELNNDHHEALSHSKYSAAFLYIFNEGKIFQWQPLTKWQLAKDDHLKLSPVNEVNAIERWRQCLRDPEFRKNSRTWARREALKVLHEFRSGK